MKTLTINEIITAVRGKLVSGSDNTVVSGVSTDTRTVAQSDLFIPLKGLNFDGHNFIDKAFEKGASAVLSEKIVETDKTLILVDDTKKALADLAEYYRGLFKIPVVAVTGSTGKTTTKDLIASVLSQKFNLTKTEGNYNNEIGLPLTIFKIDEQSNAAVLEMGMNHFGEIHNLSKIAKPDIAVITNIGVSHIENLGSRDGILKAKCEIFDCLSENGIKILNGDDDKLVTLKGLTGNTCFYGINSDDLCVYADNIIENGISEIICDIHAGAINFTVNIPVPGIHMVMNALAATAVALHLGLNAEEIKKGIELFKSADKRMDIIKTDKYTVINDTYNANPNSVKAAINVLASADTRKVCILGDMLELGTLSSELHYSVGEYAAKKGIDIIICIGNMAEEIYNGALSRINNLQKIYYYKSQDALFENLDNILKLNDTILVKASRGMKFEITTDRIMR